MLPRITLALCCLLGSLSVHAQIFDVDTIRYHGAIDKYINVVLLSDGYQIHELDQFILDATDFADKLFAETPYAQYQNYFNVFAIRVPSNESGASHPGTATDVNEPVHEVKEVDNYFGSTFDAFNIHRLLVATDANAVFTVLANNFPAYDQILILANSPHYGGSGGFRAVTSLHTSANEIAIHEIGHSFANLSDEYYAGDQYAGESINMTQETDPTFVKWKNWHGEQGIGIFQHCCSGNSAMWYRPHQNCKMRFLGVPFCAVCVEGTIERIHNLTPPLLGFSPANAVSSPIPLPLDLQVELIPPIPNTLQRVWQLNGEVYKLGVDSIQLAMEDLLSGINVVDLMIEDTTELLRIDGHAGVHLYTITWTLDNTITGIEDIQTHQNEIEWRMGPNPVADQLYLTIRSAVPQSFRLTIYDAVGRKHKSVVTSFESLSIEVADLTPGSYWIELSIDQRVLASRLLVIN